MPNTQERIPTTQEETLSTQGKTQETLGSGKETWITQTPEILKSQVDTKGRTGFIGDKYQFVEDLFEQPRRNKNYLTQSEKRQHNRRWIGTCNTVQLKKEQEEDPEIQQWKRREDPSRIKHIEGLLCRVWRPKESPNITYEQIVLPRKYRKQVIRLAHDIPFAGHLGQEKTTQRILKRFY